ncbi:MAG TPA: GtrA family protein [Candidatus Pacearchaeota archaeon]|nr:GtrA family protein [Candidatus Parcubacteria bacterium]HNZ84056.1 GtrA family protein [Candidatus Pacearchaeota archaeon]HOU45921.1 GtrA family protein [Candidatus Pacearchaeota archaeon]HPM08214.1 GtrA family protein [Candidatus Pacearchaeota archaeon]HQI74466.1 GtrA family protein [Candidatus Pacearchaeota archaeon]
MQITKRDYIFAAIVAEIDAIVLMMIAPRFALKLSAYPLLGQIISWIWLLAPILAVVGIKLASIIAQKISSIWQFAKFLLVGSSNVMIDMGTIELLQRFFGGMVVKQFYPIMVTVSFLVSSTNSFLWNKFWSFEKKDTQDKVGEAVKFYTVTIVGYLLKVGISSFIAKGVAPIAGLTHEAWNVSADFLASIIVFMWNFLGYKFLVFKK